MRDLHKASRGEEKAKPNRTGFLPLIPQGDPISTTSSSQTTAFEFFFMPTLP